MARSFLSLVPPASTESDSKTTARFPQRGPIPPDAMAIARWRQEADARRELALAGFDEGLLTGLDADTAARGAIGEFMGWVRDSIVPLARLSSPGGAGVVSEVLRRQEKDHWGLMADRAARLAEHSPDGVDRLLRIWLAVVHEAAATGFAALYTDADDGAAPR